MKQSFKVFKTPRSTISPYGVGQVVYAGPDYWTLLTYRDDAPYTHAQIPNTDIVADFPTYEEAAKVVKGARALWDKKISTHVQKLNKTQAELIDAREKRDKHIIAEAHK